MKKQLLGILAIFILIVSVPIIAQDGDGTIVVYPSGNSAIAKATGSMWVSWDITADSAETVSSSVFYLDEYDGIDFATYKPTMLYHVAGTATGAATDSVNIYVIIYGTDALSNVFPIDTVGAATITNTANTGAKTTSVTMDFNSKRAIGYYFSLTNNAVSSALTTGEFTLVLKKRENYFYKN